MYKRQQIELAGGGSQSTGEKMSDQARQWTWPVGLVVYGVFACIASGSAGAQSLAAGSAQVYPNRPVRMIVAFPPGGGNDIIARLIGARLTPRFGQQVVIDNRGGASGIIGTDIVARAAPDGHTLLFVSVSHTMNEAIRKLPYDTLGSFAPVALLGRGPNVLVANPNLPARTLPELIALAKSKPGKINYASTGVAGMHHFGGELFKDLAHVNMVHVPYKGGSAAMTELMAGRVHVMFESMSSIIQHHRAGRVRGLAVTSPKRSSSYPDIPTVAEAGVPGFDMTVWAGLITPVGIPKPVLAKLNDAINKALASPSLRERYAANGVDPVGGTPEEFGAFIKREVEKYAAISKKIGMKVD